MLANSPGPAAAKRELMLRIWHMVPLPDEDQRSVTTALFTFPDLREASTAGLCYLLDALQSGGDGLFSPCRAPSYPAEIDEDTATEARDCLLEIIGELERSAEDELIRRPVPTDPGERALRARVLVNRHMLGFDSDAFEDGRFSKLAEVL